jgi:hypothetical protein
MKIPHRLPEAYPTAATEISMIPVSRAYVIPQVINMRGAPFTIVLYTLLNVRKFSDMREKTIKSDAKTKYTLSVKRLNCFSFKLICFPVFTDISGFPHDKIIHQSIL